MAPTKLFVTFFMAVGCALLLGAGCEKKSPDGGGQPAATPGDSGGGEAPAAGGGTTAGGLLDPSTVENPATISGRVTIEGDVPVAKPVSMTAKPECVAAHGGNPPVSDMLSAGPDKGLKDVVVSISKGLESYKFNVPGEPAVVDQKGCMYDPHVFIVRVNQDLKILNSDPWAHNINVKTNRNFNEGMQKGTPPIVKPKWFKKPGPTRVACDIHSWMSAWAYVIEHPYVQLTGADGKFSITGLPPGKYTLSVWHERYPRLTAPKAVEIEVGAGETKTQDFVYTIK